MSLTLIAIVFLFLGVLVLGGWVIFLELRLRRMTENYRAMMSGRQGADLETTLLEQLARMTRAEQNLQAQHQAITALEEIRPFQLQHASVVRFNPFGDKGGDQSFAIAVLDDHTDGFVISCLHSRTDIKIYAKPIRGGQSTYMLIPEEKDAIARAMKPHA